jgi:hypothetical protein
MVATTFFICIQFFMTSATVGGRESMLVVSVGKVFMVRATEKTIFLFGVCPD